MSTGTLVRLSTSPKTAPPNTTQGTTPEDFVYPDKQMRDQTLEQTFGPKWFYQSYTPYLAGAEHSTYASQRCLPGTTFAGWDVTEPQVSRLLPNIWSTQKLKALLLQPLGSPIDLTIEEADAIVRLAAGSRPDLPSGKEFVEQVRELLGHSLIERLKKSE